MRLLSLHLQRQQQLQRQQRCIFFILLVSAFIVTGGNSFQPLSLSSSSSSSSPITLSSSLGSSRITLGMRHEPPSTIVVVAASNGNNNNNKNTFFRNMGKRNALFSSATNSDNNMSDNSNSNNSDSNENSTTTSTTESSTNVTDANNIEQLKMILIEKIKEFRTLKERDGDLSIDFGVKGGELNATDRSPNTVDFYQISKDVGDKAQEIFEICDQLSKCSSSTPNTEPTKYFGDAMNGELSPLNGAWKSLFNNAADANFSKNSTRGFAKAQNIVNATLGRIINVVDFVPPSSPSPSFETTTSTTATKSENVVVAEPTPPTLKQLNVVLKATAVNSNRIEIQFRYVRAVFTKFLWFRKEWSLYVPVPGPFITKCIEIFTRIITLGFKKRKGVTKGYFDILYLDEHLRIHKTGQGNLFVQVKDSWDLARPLL